MIDLSPELITVLMLGGVFVGLMTGYPLALVIGGIAMVVGFTVFGPNVANVIYSRSSELMIGYIMLAVPLFTFMGNMLEYSGITERLYDALYVWLGGVRGGLALTTLLIGTILAATVGIIAASVTMLALVGFPSMVKRGYDKSLASGAVCAGGTLGILIPPSIMLVIYGPMAGISVGKLFFGAFMPGFLLSALYMMYVAIRCYLEPQLGPPVPAEERKVPLGKKITMVLTAIVPPVILVLSVLGVIYMGIAPPTEAAGMGALAATLLVIAYGKFSWKVLWKASFGTFTLCGFVMAIGALAFAFTGIFISSGGGDVVKRVVMAAPGGKWGIFFIIQFTIFILGFFIDWIGIVFIMVPIMTPIAAALNFDQVWFAIMVCVNLQTAFMTPPFAAAIFICKGAVPAEYNLTMVEVIRGVIPYVVLILVGLALCVAFPEIILWLPNAMIKPL